MSNERLKKITLSILIGVFISFIMIPGQVLAAEDLPEPTSEFYIYDETNTISQEVAQYIIQTNEALFTQTGAQIVVAIINSLEDNSIDEYSNQLYRKWEIGSEENDNGVLLLVALEEREMRIEVGYGLEGAIPDGKAGEVRDQYIVPSFEQSQYNQGILQGFQAILNEVEREYEIDITPQGTDQYDQSLDSQEEPKEMSLLQRILMIGGLIVFLFIDFTFFGGALTFTLLRMLSRGRFRGGGGGNRGGGGSSGGGGASGGW